MNYQIRTSINLFTLDIEKLYPSIQPRYAEEAFRRSWRRYNSWRGNKTIVEPSFKESYKEKVSKSSIRIPTGGSLSRLADISLH